MAPQTVIAAFTSSHKHSVLHQRLGLWAAWDWRVMALECSYAGHSAALNSWP